MVLQSRGCVDRARDSTEHKADLSPFTPIQPPPNLETQEESKVTQMRVSVSAQGELKAGSEQGEKKELGKEKSAKGGTARVLTFVQRYRKEDIFQFKSMLNESGSSTSWPTVPWESLSFLFEI